MMRNWPDRSAITPDSMHRSPRFVSGQRSQVEYQRFSEDYFSGCDVSIYFGDILVDDIVTIQFSMVENVAPIYGYASHTYDAVARGTRIIQGSFRIAFKEAYYIQAITNEIAYNRKTNITKTKPFAFNTTYKENTIEGLMAAASNFNTDQFENLADEYERSLWGEGTDVFKQRVSEQEETSFFYPDHPNSDRQENLHKDGYNIMIVYGAMEREQDSPHNKYEEINHTVNTLVGVQITGVTQQIDPSGQPIYEEYSFIARDLNGNFSKVGKY